VVISEFLKGYKTGTKIEKDGRDDWSEKLNILAGWSNIFLQLLYVCGFNVWLNEIQTAGQLVLYEVAVT
jgi:hypothetical protein